MKNESIFLDDYYDENQSSSNNVKQVGSIANRKTSKRDNPNEYRVYLAGGVSPALNTAQGGGRTPCIIV